MSGFLKYLPSDAQITVCAEAYAMFIEMAQQNERARITSNIRDRISDLRSCGKPDNCHELAGLIESYIKEWTE